uniref:BLM10_mid domain-containing protein n=1 Tax=Caenorhabditis japonica TaxID=281687 RepID=A0A8R1I1B4_CAEJA
MQTRSTEFYTEEKVDFGTLWWLSVASRIVKVHPKLLLEQWHHVETMMNLVMPIKKCTTATEKALNIFDNLLDQLTSIQINSLVERRKMYDLPSDQFLAIRHWAASVEKKHWNPEWIIPTQESIDRSTQLLRTWLVPALDVLNNPTGIAKKELLHRLFLIRSGLLGACFSLPLLEGDIIGLTDSHTIQQDKEMLTIVKPKGTPEISIDGKNVRQMALDCTLGLIDYLLEHSPDDVKSIQEAVSILRGLPLNRGYTKELYNTSATSYRVTKTMLCDKLAGNRSNIEMIVEEYVMLLHRKRLAHTQGWHYNEQHKKIQDKLLKVATSTYSENRSKAQSILLAKLREHPYSYKKIVNDILAFLKPNEDVSHEQLKGALYLLIDGKKQSLMLRMEFEQQAKIWPALVKIQHSEKPSIIALLETAQNIIVDNYESYRLKYEWEPKNVEAAWKLLKAADEGSPLYNTEMLQGPSVEQIDKYKGYLEDKYQKAKASYYLLIDQLFALANDSNLHWRPLDMAYSMLSMQIRRDSPLPDGVIKMFVRLLINDTVKTRRIASAVVASWLKINKPKAVKVEYVLPFKAPNTSVGAQHPIQYGFRTDNRIMMYEEEKLPKTDEEWDAFQFCAKQHWGIYTWPKKLITYAPLKEQKAIDRTYEQFSDVEKYIVETFKEEKFMTRLRELFSIEMKKEDDLFNAVHFSLFQGLFRSYGDVLAYDFKAQLEILLASSKEYEQKLAAEITAGMMNGSKLWRYEKQRKLWSWLDPLLTKTFELMKEDGLRNWGVAIATVCGCSEPRMLKPLIDLLFKLVERPTENAYAASSRMFLIQSALCQFEWRGVELWNKLVGMMRGCLVQPFANLRDRVAM